MGCGSSNVGEKNKFLYDNYRQQCRTIPMQRSGKKISYKGITILENVQQYIPDSISRDEVKKMVYDALNLTDLKNKSTRKLKEQQIEGLIDLIMITVSSNGNKSLEDKRLDDLKAIIGFYDADKENVKKIFFKDEKPTEEEVEEKLNDIISENEGAKLFAIQLQN